jgi:hypothetical protein
MLVSADVTIAPYNKMSAVNQTVLKEWHRTLTEKLCFFFNYSEDPL